MKKHILHVLLLANISTAFAQGNQNELLATILKETTIDKSIIKDRSKKILEDFFF